MHTRRVATFLLGSWIGCGVLMAFLIIQNYRSPDWVMASLTPPAGKLLEKLGQQDARLLLGYQAAEQSRAYLSAWEIAQTGLAIAVGACLFLATQRRTLPLVLCGIMLALVLFQHFGVAPELRFRGREVDFPPGSEAFGARTRVLLLAEVYIGAEGAKLVVGVVLATYLFLLQSGGRIRRKRGGATEGTERTAGDQ